MKKMQFSSVIKIAIILLLAMCMFLSVDLLNYRSTRLTLLGYLVEIGGLLGIVLLSYSIIKNKK